MVNALIHPLKRHGNNPNIMLSLHDFNLQESHDNFALYNEKSSSLHNLQQQIPHLALKPSSSNLDSPPSIDYSIVTARKRILKEQKLV